LRKVALILAVVVLVCLILTAGAYGVLTSSKTVGTTGKISTVNVGVYKDSACTQTASSIDWGNLTAGGTATYVLYIKNTGNTKETLSITTNSWSPTSTSQYLTITCDQNNAVLTVNQIVKATFTLNVSSTTNSSIAAFSNNIVITGTMQ
jgi:hypothetical protein